MSPGGGDLPVVVVTGGGGGIGAAIATELGRQGAFVVTVDPLVTVDGTGTVPAPEQTTAERIVAAGGEARASNASVTDRRAIAALFTDLVAERGRLDGVVNVAGITRPTGFAKGEEADWDAVLSVHLGGYLNVLSAALPVMAAAGRGQILGVTSGSGWRAADAGAYSQAKRAVAALTWQLGRAAPPGVTVNAISPIAMTRMVTAALARAGGPDSGSARRAAATGGLSLSSMPPPDALGPLGAALAGGALAGLRGQVLFAGGSEVAVVRPPRLIEVIRSDGVGSLARVMEAVEGSLIEAEAAQATSGGSNPRFGDLFTEEPPPVANEARAGSEDTGAEGGVEAAADAAGTAGDRSGSTVLSPLRTAVVVTGETGPGRAIAARLRGAGVAVEVVSAGAAAHGFAQALEALQLAASTLDGADAVVLALSTPEDDGVDRCDVAADVDGWESILVGHADLVAELRTDAAWSRAAADHAHSTRRPLRLVTVVAASDAGGRSRAQAAAQLARASRRATREEVSAFAVSVEDRSEVSSTTELVLHLLSSPAAPALAGAELAVGSGWIGLRSHPNPVGSVVYGGPELPRWFGTALGEIIGDVAETALQEHR